MRYGVPIPVKSYQCLNTDADPSYADPSQRNTFAQVSTTSLANYSLPYLPFYKSLARLASKANSTAGLQFDMAEVLADLKDSLTKGIIDCYGADCQKKRQKVKSESFDISATDRKNILRPTQQEKVVSGMGCEHKAMQHLQLRTLQ